VVEKEGDGKGEEKAAEELAASPGEADLILVLFAADHNRRAYRR